MLFHEHRKHAHVYVKYVQNRCRYGVGGVKMTIESVVIVVRFVVLKLEKVSFPQKNSMFYCRCVFEGACYAAVILVFCYIACGSMFFACFGQALPLLGTKPL